MGRIVFTKIPGFVHMLNNISELLIIRVYGRCSRCVNLLQKDFGMNFVRERRPGFCTISLNFTNIFPFQQYLKIYIFVFCMTLFWPTGRMLLNFHFVHHSREERFFTHLNCVVFPNFVIFLNFIFFLDSLYYFSIVTRITCAPLFIHT